MIKKTFKYIVWSLVALFSLLLLSLAIALATFSNSESATAWLANKIQQASNGSFSYQEVSGTINKLSFKGLEINSEDSNVILGEAKLNLKLKCLLNLTLCIDNLSAQQIDIRLFATTEQDQATNNDPNFLLRWILRNGAVELKNLDLEKFNLEFDADQLSFSKVQAQDLVIALAGTRLDDITIQQLKFIAANKTAVTQQSSSSFDFQQLIDQLLNQQTQPSKELHGLNIDFSLLSKKIKDIFNKPLVNYDLNSLIHSNYPIEIDNFMINNSSAVFNEEFNLEIKQLVGTIKVYDESAVIVNASTNWGLFNLNADTDKDKVYLELDATFTPQFPIAGLAGVRLNSSIEGNLQQNLKLMILATQPQADNITRSQQLIELKDFSLSNEQKLIVTPTQFKHSLTVQGYLSLNQANWPLNLSATVNKWQINDLLVNSLNYSINGNYLNNLNSFDLSLNHGKDSFILTGKIIGKENKFVIDPVSLTINGDQVLQHSSTILLDDELSLSAKNNLKDLNLQHLKDLLGIDLKEFELNGQLHGNLDFDLVLDNLVVQADFKKSFWSFVLKPGKLTGNINGLKLNFNYQAKAYRDQLQLNDIKLQLGDSEINQKGFIYIDRNLYNSLIELNGNFKLANLEKLIPQLKINLQGDFHLNNLLLAPYLNLNLEAQNTSYQDSKLKNLKLNFSIDSLNLYQTNLKLNIDNFNYQQLDIDNAQITLNGNYLNHQATIKVKGDPINLDIDYKATLEDELYRAIAKLSELKINKIATIKFTKDQHFTYDLKSQDIQIFNNRIVSKGLDIELTKSKFNLNSFNYDIAAIVNDFNLDLIKHYLNESTILSGNLKGLINATQVNYKANYQATIDRDSKIKLSQNIGKVNSVDIKLDNIKAEATFDHNQAAVNLQARINNRSPLNISLNLNNLEGVPSTNSNIKLSNFSLDDFSGLLNNSEKVKGILDLNLDISGYLDDPTIVGQSNLKSILVDVTSVPFNIQDGEIKSVFKGKTATLIGQLKTQSSPIDFTGSIDFNDLKNLSSLFNFKSNRLKIIYPLYGTILANLDLNLSLSNDKAAITGTAVIPNASIKIANLPKSPVLEQDVVLVSSKKHEDTNSSSFAIDTDIQISILPQAKLDAYNLKGNLEGNILVRNNNLGIGLYGQVKVLNGVYTDYGQNLRIKEGVVNFNGNATNPTLNVVAIRANDNVISNNSVGVKIVGPVNNFHVSIFSEPAMNQNAALQYLLTGEIPKDDHFDSSNFGIYLLTTSFTQLTNSLESIGNSVGISNLHISQSKSGELTQLNLNGNLTPNTNISYGVGIFNGLSAFSLKYRVLSKFFIEASVGYVQSVYGIYSFLWD